MSAVSVIIPAFNAERFLERTLKSAFKQVGVELEVIFVNDGSTDSTLEIAHRFSEQEPRLRIITYERNRGPCFARNRGIERASGDYVAFLDADDLWHPHNLALRIEALIKTNASAAYSYVTEIDEDDVHQMDYWQEPFERVVTRQLAAHYFLYNGSNLLVCRSVLEMVKENGDWFLEDWFEGAEDWQFAMRVALKTKFAVARQSLCYYRSHPFSRSKPDAMTRGIKRLRNWYESTGNGRLADINCAMDALREAHRLLSNGDLAGAGPWFALSKELYPLETLSPEFSAYSRNIADKLASYSNKVIMSCPVS